MNIFSKMAWKTLSKNRTRTLVTIIGIALSAAMFTAVTTAVSSYLGYYRGYMEYTYGSWNASYYDLTADEVAQLREDSEIKTVTALELIGFAVLEDSQNEDKPYLCVRGMDENAEVLLPIHLTSGRMPENSSEILIPDHLSSNGGITYEVGDVITLEVGERTWEGTVLNNHVSYNSEGESVENCVEYTYTVVGTYSRSSIEDYIAPGYTALTLSDETVRVYDVYYQLKDEYQAVSYTPSYLSGDSTWNTNDHYLDAYGLSGESRENTLLDGFAAVLMAIIFFGSVALIYNSFSISVSERMHLFAMLSSVGATRRQLVRMVLTEGLFLAVVGIPVGVLSGVLGMGVTFSIIGDDLSGMIYEVYPETFSMTVSVQGIAEAAVIALVTILISAYLPVRKALKHSAMETIRGSKEITIRKKEMKQSRLMQRLFGFEGTLASRNYRRSRKKYRATVVSIFVSIVLFVTSTSFCAYMEASVNSEYKDVGYDVKLSAYLENDDTDSAQALAEKLSGLMGVTSVGYYSTATTTIMADAADLDDSFGNYYEYWENLKDIPEQAFVKAMIVFVDDDAFDSFAKSQGLDAQDYYGTATTDGMYDVDDADGTVVAEGADDTGGTDDTDAEGGANNTDVIDDAGVTSNANDSDSTSEENSTDTADGSETLRVLFYNKISYYERDNKLQDRERTASIFAGSGQKSFSFAVAQLPENSWYLGCWVEDGIYQWTYEDLSAEDYDTSYLPAAENSKTFAVTANLVDELPDGLSSNAYSGYYAVCLMPYSQMSQMCGLFGTDAANTTLPYSYAEVEEDGDDADTDMADEDAAGDNAATESSVEAAGIAIESGAEATGIATESSADVAADVESGKYVILEDVSVYYTINTDSHAATVDAIEEMWTTTPGATFMDVDDIAEDMQVQRTFIAIMKVFCYGFIVLISLIAVANVFNTISTNIQLRGRELAMLQSVGMSHRGLQRMMSYECLLYGSRGLVYGLIVSVLLVYLYYRASEVNMDFFIPWYSIVIAIVGVFAVVFATMIYAIRRLEKENTMDLLKNENI